MLSSTHLIHAMPHEPDFQSFILNLVAKNECDRPIFAVNLDDVCDKVHHWSQNFPRITPFYAMKCNDVPRLLSTLSDMGCGFDCASIVSVIRKGHSLILFPNRKNCKPLKRRE